MTRLGVSAELAIIGWRLFCLFSALAFSEHAMTLMPHQAT
jgi:hypothetical protein